MSGLSTQLQTVPQSPAKPARVPKVQGKTKAALDLMVWEALTDNQAAVRVGITIGAIRLALKQPHYRAYFRSQCEMLRTRENPRNIHALVDVRDNSGNANARVAAVKALEGQLDQQVGGTISRSPGVVVQIINAPAAQPPAVQVGTLLTQSDAPVIENDGGST